MPFENVSKVYTTTGSPSSIREKKLLSIELVCISRKLKHRSQPIVKEPLTIKCICFSQPHSSGFTCYLSTQGSNGKLGKLSNITNLE